jgi:5,10-methenyltetrahydrofolate synthetase
MTNLNRRPALRQQLLAARMAVPVAERRARGATITRRLLEAFPVRGPLVVGLYWPYKGEFDPRFVVRHWRAAGARAALPVVVHKNAPLEFREWWPGLPTRAGVFDLPVPVDTAVLRPDVLLIPPIGFDSRGYRLGYGGGFYDRTLAHWQPPPLRIGVAFELSRMTGFEAQPHDIPMDVIVTEAGIYPAGS